MYAVEKTDLGIKVRLTGFIEQEEANEWFQEMLKKVEGIHKDFCVFVDMRGFEPATQDIQKQFASIQKIYRDKGMLRSVVILDNIVATVQLIRTAKESGIYANERYISAENNPHWEQQGMDWLTHKKDPDA
ncbi:MAG: hypothetical protein GY845_31320 [Planctomycetes bacterium]|nr:hypothetical protein [Planctomycetota bacterium]